MERWTWRYQERRLLLHAATRTLMCSPAAAFACTHAYTWDQAPLVAWLWHWFVSWANPSDVFVIPEDLNRKLLMSDEARWCSATSVRQLGGGMTPGAKDSGDLAWCGGPPVSFFQDEYLHAHELFPTKKLNMCVIVVGRSNRPIHTHVCARAQLAAHCLVAVRVRISLAIAAAITAAAITAAAAAVSWPDYCCDSTVLFSMSFGASFCA